MLHIWIRASHRWLGLTLTLSVAANFIAMAFGPPPAAITYAPLLPLTLLIATGMYLFVRPYVSGKA
jgi:hypothetical protein